MNTLKEPVTLVTTLGQDSPETSETKIKSIPPTGWREIIPSSLSTLLRTALTQEGTKGKTYDSTKLIDLFNCLMGWTKVERRLEDFPDDEECTITVNSQVLKKKFGNDYSKYLSFFERHGVIRWIEGKTKAGYVTKLKDGRGSCKKVTIIYPYFLPSLDVVTHPGNKHSEKRRRNLLDLRTMGDRHRYDVLINKVKVNTTSIHPYLSCAEANGDITKLRADSHREALGRIVSGSIFYKCDKFGRRHTPYTSFPRIYRSNLTIGEEPVSSVDIRSSQVRFLLVLLRMWIKQTEGDQGEESGDSLRANPSPGDQPPIHSSLSYVVHCFDKWTKGFNLDALSDLKKDIDLFEEVLRGDIYTTAPQWILEDKLIRPRKFEKDGYTDRDVCKRRFLKSLFGTHNVKKPITRCIVKRFPALAKALQVVKVGKSPAQRNVLCYALQSLESYIVLDLIGDDLENAGIAYIPIHDSALCPISRFEEVKHIFNERLAEYGLVDAVKAEETLPELTKDSFSKHGYKDNGEGIGGNVVTLICWTSFQQLAA